MKFDFLILRLNIFCSFTGVKKSSTGIPKNIENLFLEKPWGASTPFTYRQDLVHVIIVSNAPPDLQLRPQNKVKLDIFRYFLSSTSLSWG